VLTISGSVMGDNNYYEARARDVNLYSITSSEHNALILEKLRNNDVEFKMMGIVRGDGNHIDGYDVDVGMYPCFHVEEGDDLGWLGYFIGKSKRLKAFLISHLRGDHSFGQGLAQNRSIQKLYIKKALGKAGFQSLVPFFQNTNTLQELKFRTKFSNAAKNIAMLLNQCQIRSLRRIKFDESFLDEEFDEIACALRAQPQLEELILSPISGGVVPFDQRGYAALGNTMKNWTSPCLNKLVIYYSGLHDEGLLALVEGMANCVNLEHLEICGNEISVTGLKALSSLFQSKKFCLQSLNVRHMNIVNKGMITLASGLAAVESLKSLNLSFNEPIGEEGLQSLAVSLSNNKNLETLDLMRTGPFSAMGLRCLSGVILTASNLKELNLGGNSINDEGFQALAVGLRKHPTLAVLKLAGNSIGSEGLQALAAAELSSLRWLNLTSNAINDEALGVLGEGIENFVNLEILNLTYNNLITSTGLAVFTAIFQRDGCSLKHLDLFRMNIEDGVAHAFAEGLVGNESLTHLSFGYTNLTPSAWSAFSTLLCDTSSVNNVYLSNHTLERIGGSYSLEGIPSSVQRYLSNHTIEAIGSRYFHDPRDGIPSSVRQYLEINRQKQYDVPICKILMNFSNLDMTPLLQWKLKLLPCVVAWFERAQSCRTYMEESTTKFERRELSALYQFIRGLPLLAASGFHKQMSTDAHSKKRKFDLCDK
jgi:Ran GTPase-activating protein (RanGAP) involved in mRNA processing and transport